MEPNASSSRDAVRSAPSQLSRRTWFAAAVTLFVTSTLVAFLQDPAPDPFDTPLFPSWSWWSSPRESSSFRRLPVVTTGINDVFSLKGKGRDPIRVWAVGNGGLVLRSADAGRTWEGQFVRSGPPPLDGMDVNQDSPAQEYAPSNPPVQQAPTPPDALRKGAGLRIPTEGRAWTGPSSPRSIAMSRGSSPDGRTANARLEARSGDRAWVVASQPEAVPERSAPIDGKKPPDSRLSGRGGGINPSPKTPPGDPAAGEKNATTDRPGHRAANPEGPASLNAVFFTDTDHGWAAGDRGTILSSTDGGKTWQSQTSGVVENLEAIHFVDPMRGWAGGEGIALLSTTDGGRTWRRRPMRVRPVHALQFLDATTGWAGGPNGTVLKTEDGGATWINLYTGLRGAIDSIRFVDAQHGWAASAQQGVIAVTSDGGARWQMQRLPRTEGFAGISALDFRDDSTGWVAGSNGAIFSTTDGGLTWQVRPSGVSHPLLSVSFSDARRGWAVGDSGTLLFTTDGGGSWHAGTRPSLSSAWFLDPKSGWAAGAGGTILATTDGGLSWRRQSTPITEDLYGIQFSNRTTGRAFAAGSTVLGTEDGGRTWQVLPGQAAPDPNLTARHFVDSTHGWAAGPGSSIATTSDGGITWRRQETGTRARLRSVHFVDLNRGWAVGDRATIVVTADGGSTWKRQAPGIEEDLISVGFASERRGWAVGAGGTVIRTTDGGVTWTHAEPTSAPAAWYYLTLAAVIALVVPSLRKPAPAEARTRSVADILVSDKPLQPGDPDPMDLESTALGLSRFLRNRKTSPPLTIAVTGRWGSGKSSLMNLLKADLVKVGFPTVWFNAWHNQKEQDLLSALLESVRRQAIPSAWTPVGLAFRLRLLTRRSWRRWPWVFALLVMFTMSVGYFQGHPDGWGKASDAVKHGIEGIAKDPGSTISNLVSTPRDMIDAAFGFIDYALEAAVPKEPSTRGVLGFLFTSGAGILLTVNRWIRAFGAVSSKSGSKDGAARDPEARAGARESFAREFRDVTEALKPRKLLVFVDDLDRCRPQNVAEVLEAINFLVSAGDCYVVMGIEREMVKRCVGLAYADIARELVDLDPTPAAAVPGLEPKKVPLWVFAEQYLEKLINIEVPVPEPAEEESQRLIAPAAERDERGRAEQIVDRTLAMVRRTAPWALAASALTASYLIGLIVLEPQPSGRSVTISTPVAPAPGDLSAGTPGEASIGAGATAPLVREKEVISFTPGRPQRTRIWLLWCSLCGVLLFGAAVFRVAQRPEIFVKDSDEFEAALRGWHPLVAARRNTPRALKRFVNEVRYYAMSQRTQAPALSPVHRLLALLGLDGRAGAGATAAAERPARVREDLIVTLTALRHVYKEEFDLAGGRDWVGAVKASLSGDERLSKELRGKLMELLERSTEDLRHARDHYEGMATGIRFAGDAPSPSRAAPGTAAGSAAPVTSPSSA